jgi:glycosyltransferase involved in cell wall biosynthesis
VTWAILTGEYPPQPGGVSDYTRQVARGLAEAGDEVHVWTTPSPQAPPRDPGVEVHRLPGRFGPGSLVCLQRGLRRLRGPVRLLVQYVPHAFGWKAMNLPFCWWLGAQRRAAVWVMFHEVATPVDSSQPLRHRLLGRVTRLMAAAVVRAADRLFVSIPAWERMLRPLAPRSAPAVNWLPVPSNVVAAPAPEAAARIRARLTPDPAASVIGHFGTYGSLITPLLKSALPPLLERDARRVALLLGRNGDKFASEMERDYPHLRGRLVAPGGLPEAETAAHLAACDLLLQPYPDGVSSRRGSFMAGLAAGLPVVTTEGWLSEPLWRETGAVSLAPIDAPEALVSATEDLLAHPARRAELAARAGALYRKRFSLDRLIHTLRAAS